MKMWSVMMSIGIDKSFKYSLFLK